MHPLSVAVLLLALALGGLLQGAHLLWPDAEHPPGQGLHLVCGNTSEYRQMRTEVLDSVWDEAREAYNFGRYRHPPVNQGLHPLTAMQDYTQKKEWYWNGFASDTLMISVATLNFGYASNAIMYYHDLTTGETDKLALEIHLLGRVLGTSFEADGKEGSTLASGCSKWELFGARMEQCTSDKLIQVNAKGTMASGKQVELQLQFDMGADESLNFVFPIGERRPAIVSKMSGMPATAKLWIGDRTDEAALRTVEASGLGMADWTRSLSARHTRWYWTAFTFVDKATNTRIGIQMSNGVYEDEWGNGVENCLFVNGKLHMLETRVRFKAPKRSELHTQMWQVQATADNAEVAYDFTPRDKIHGEFHLGVLDGNLHHIWGRASGSVKVGGQTYVFSDVPAVVEDHYAFW